MNTSTDKITVKQATNSRLPDVDFDNLTFGGTFTDHMFMCDFKDGAWKDATILPYGNLSISPAAKVFHYGQAVFEGMKAFKDENGDVFLFRPEENLNRINKSSKRMAIPEFPKDLFFEALHKLLALDKGWVQGGLGNSLYIRPFAMATQVGVSASPADEYKFMILMSPVKAYYTGDVKVLVAEKYSRSADGGVGAAKAAGNYGAQFFPTNLAREKGFQQVAAAKDGSLKEIFGSGTAAVISPVSAFGYAEEIFELEKPADSYATRFKKELMDIQYNRAEDTFNWRYPIS